MRPRRALAPGLAALAAGAALGCATPRPKMTFGEAGFRPLAPVQAGPAEPDPVVLPPAAVPAPHSVALEIADGPPIDATLVRFATEARSRRMHHAERAGFPADAIAAWRALAVDLDHYLARALPQTPLLETVRARVTMEAEWDYDGRRYGRPPADLAAEIASRSARFARRIETARTLGFGIFVARRPSRLRWPVEQAGISSLFGLRRHPLQGMWRMHNGVDLAADPGKVVWAAALGWVVRAGWTGGYGLMVEVRHPGDLTTRYSHLSAVLCSPGDPVDPGQALGLVGRTGLATGPHLHFEVWRGGEPTDPLPLLGVRTPEGSAGK